MVVGKVGAALSAVVVASAGRNLKFELPDPRETTECGAGSEPDEREYFEIESVGENGELPEVKHFSGDAMTKEIFERLMARGEPFVVEQSKEITSWDLAKWDCDFFSNDPEFKQASMLNHYTASEDSDGESIARFGESDWQTKVAASG